MADVSFPYDPRSMPCCWLPGRYGGSSGRSHPRFKSRPRRRPRWVLA